MSWHPRSFWRFCKREERRARPLTQREELIRNLLEPEISMEHAYAALNQSPDLASSTIDAVDHLRSHSPDGLKKWLSQHPRRDAILEYIATHKPWERRKVRG